MARKTTVEGGQVAAEAADEAAGAGREEASHRHAHGQRSPNKRWSGAGGRWWIWLGRVVLWAFIIVVIVNGIRAPFQRFSNSGGTHAAGTHAPGSKFPKAQASAYALDFASIYLNYSSSTADQRASELAKFVPSDSDEQLGWNGFGTAKLQSAQVAGVKARDDKHGVVTLAVRVNDRWMQLAVPIYSSHGGMVVSGEPALTAAPRKASPPAAPPINHDGTTEAQLRSQLPSFFRAYAASDTASLDRFLSSGASVNGLNGSVQYVSLKDVNVPQGGGTRHATVTVEWRLPSSTHAKASGGELESTYDLTVVRSAGKWDVKSIRASTQPAQS